MGLFSCCGSTEAVQPNKNPLEEAENDKKIHAYSWWRRLGRPNKDLFESKISSREDADITKADIDLLPWNESETAVDEAKMNKLIYKRANKAGNQTKSDTQASNMPLTESQRRQRAYEWWGRLYKPTKADFKARIARIKYIEVEIGDIDLLPWNEDETAVDELQMFQMNRTATIKALTASLQYDSYREEQAKHGAETPRPSKEKTKKKEKGQDDTCNDGAAHKEMTGEQRALYEIAKKKKKHGSSDDCVMGEGAQSEKKNKKERTHVETRGGASGEANQEQALHTKKKKVTKKKKPKVQKEIVLEGLG